LGCGTAFGIVGGWVLGTIIRRQWLPEHLHNLAAVSAIFAVRLNEAGLEGALLLVPLTFAVIIWISDCLVSPVVRKATAPTRVDVVGVDSTAGRRRLIDRFTAPRYQVRQKTQATPAPAACLHQSPQS
jgi:hypothetical protein